jgi:hypothetical protein
MYIATGGQIVKDMRLWKFVENNRTLSKKEVKTLFETEEAKTFTISDWIEIRRIADMVPGGQKIYTATTDKILAAQTIEDLVVAINTLRSRPYRDQLLKKVEQIKNYTVAQVELFESSRSNRLKALAREFRRRQ